MLRLSFFYRIDSWSRGFRQLFEQDSQAFEKDKSIKNVVMGKNEQSLEPKETINCFSPYFKCFSQWAVSIIFKAFIRSFQRCLSNSYLYWSIPCVNSMSKSSIDWRCLFFMKWNCKKITLNHLQIPNTCWSLSFSIFITNVFLIYTYNELCIVDE